MVGRDRKLRSLVVKHKGIKKVSIILHYVYFVNSHRIRPWSLKIKDHDIKHFVCSKFASRCIFFTARKYSTICMLESRQSFAILDLKIYLLKFQARSSSKGPKFRHLQRFHLCLPFPRPLLCEFEWGFLLFEQWNAGLILSAQAFRDEYRCQNISWFAGATEIVDVIR